MFDVNVGICSHASHGFLLCPAEGLHKYLQEFTRIKVSHADPASFSKNPAVFIALIWIIMDKNSFEVTCIKQYPRPTRSIHEALLRPLPAAQWQWRLNASFRTMLQGCDCVYTCQRPSEIFWPQSWVCVVLNPIHETESAAVTAVRMDVGSY